MPRSGWLGGAIAAVVAVAATGVALWVHRRQQEPNRKAALEVTLTGHQFWWEIGYPQLGITTANEMHLPVGEAGKPIAVRLTVTSADVGYGLRIRALDVEVEAIPGEAQLAWLQPKATGVMEGECAKNCSGAKGEMKLRVESEAVSDFRAWVARQRLAAVDDPAEAEGKEIFEHTACVSCHTIAGTVAGGRFGPDLTHLGSRATIAAGALPNTKENLRAFIDNPLQMKPGCLMPAVHLNAHDLDAVTAYLASLR